MGSTTKGDDKLKQVVISLAVVILATGIFAGMVLYTVSVMRQVQLKIITGQYATAEVLNERYVIKTGD